ncbi:uncharacterized protein LOC107471611 [Arachis duranensis]|uniref:Uncharacterized protein LOC107471611 n=1 Tax=Arachis duranensis TaxID=130453 RepID=A0A6P4C7J6_ARADU|nr:uncharacterized protein LOC107471611 [Arachis duranensis]
MERGKVTNTSHHHNPKSPPTTTLPHNNNNNNSPHHLNKCQHHQTITPHNLHSNSALTIFNSQTYFKEVTTTTTTSSNNNTRVSPVVATMNSQHKNNNNAELSKTTMKTTKTTTELDNRPPRTAVSVSALSNNRFNKPKAAKNRASYCPNSKPAWLLRKCPCFCKTSVQVKQPTPNPKSKTPFTKIPPTSQSQPQPQQQQQKSVTISVTENSEELQPDMDTVLGKPTTEGFTFPSLAAATPTATSCHGKKQVLNVVHEEYPIPPRHSMEVFQPIITVDRERERENNNNNRRRNLASPPSPLSRDADDASDASSDLFEIESFSLQAVAALLTCPQPVVTMAPTGSEVNNDDNNKTSAFDLSLVSGAGKSSGSEFLAAAAEQQRQGAANNNSTKNAEDTAK